MEYRKATLFAQDGLKLWTNLYSSRACGDGVDLFLNIRNESDIPSQSFDSASRLLIVFARNVKLEHKYASSF